MSDREKINVANKIMAHAWEFVPMEKAGYWEGIIIALDCVLDESECGDD